MNMDNKNKLFNIYYINFPKVYEVKMTMSNIEIKDFSVEEDNKDKKSSKINAKMGGNVFALMKATLGGEINDSRSVSNKIVETFEVKTTKSVILKDVISKAKTLENFIDIKVGDLIMVDNVLLDLSNEHELKIIKLFMNSSFPIRSNTQDFQGVDFEKLFNVMFKDYAYKLICNNESFDMSVLAKIPVSFESEFESSYSIEDLLIGNVSLIGIYKGRIKGDKVRTSFDYYSQLGELAPAIGKDVALKLDKTYSEIKHSQEDGNLDGSPSVAYNITNNDFNETEFHYIDLLAVVQIVNVQQENIDE